jgi:hypothetical protein
MKGSQRFRIEELGGHVDEHIISTGLSLDRFGGMQQFLTPVENNGHRGEQDC